jgi:hypothetical protein
VVLEERARGTWIEKVVRCGHKTRDSIQVDTYPTWHAEWALPDPRQTR